MKHFAPFRLDPAGLTLWRGQARVPLTHKAFELLRVLVDRAGHVVTRDTLLTLVWPNIHVHPDNIKVLVAEIRRALGDDPSNPRYIRSVLRRGYVFVAPVVEAPVELSSAGAPAIFVGRDREMNQLLTEFDVASDGERRLVLVSGEGESERRRFARPSFAPPRPSCHARELGAVPGPLRSFRAVLSATRRSHTPARSASDDAVISVCSATRRAGCLTSGIRGPRLADAAGSARGHAARMLRKSSRVEPSRDDYARDLARGYSLGGSGDHRRPCQSRSATRPGTASRPATTRPRIGALGLALRRARLPHRPRTGD
jgi:DNA-binding winged helix-turn-helix (wHTH) protein